MDSELQEAIADYERPALAEWMKDHPMLGVIVEAARKVANPDYEAAVSVEWDREESNEENIKRVVDAALDITEDT